MLCPEVQNYISVAKGLPFFYVVGDENYCSVLDELKQADVSVVRMSDFCFKDDKFPSVDEWIIFAPPMWIIGIINSSSSDLANIWR